MREQLEDADSKYIQWGLAAEIVTWGFEKPTPSQLYDALFAAKEPIEWNRIGIFQEITVRLVANAILEDGGKPVDTYVKGEMTREKEKALQPSRGGYHVYCSGSNPGAAELLAELSTGIASVLHVTSTAADLLLCDHMLLYLTARTWTGGDRSAAFAKEVMAAIKAGVHLLLVHEMPGAGGQEGRHGCEFGAFFSCDNGTTPDALLSLGIYDQIALPFKGGEWRKASLRLLQNALASSDADAVAIEAEISKPHLDRMQSLGALMKVRETTKTRSPKLSTVIGRRALSSGRRVKFLPASTAQGMGHSAAVSADIQVEVEELHT